MYELVDIDEGGLLAWQERALCAQTDPEAFKHRLRRRGGAPLDRAVVEAEARAVADADDGVAVDLAVAQQAAAVRAPVVDRVERLTAAQQHDGRVPHHHAARLVLREGGRLAGVSPVARARVERGLVRADALHERHVRAEVAADDQGGGAGQPEQLSARGGAPSPRRERGAVEGERRGVGGGMRQPHAADARLDDLAVGPVVGARQRRQRVGGDADRDQPRRGLPVAVTAEHVEHRRAHERRDHEVGHQRVQRVAEPGAAERVLHRPGRDRVAQRLAERLPRPVEHVGVLYRPHRAERRALVARPPPVAACLRHRLSLPRAGRAEPADGAQRTPRRSTTNTSVSSGPITPPAPLVP